MSNDTRTINEIIASINHSSQKVVLLEGKDDMAIYRTIKKMRPDLPFEWEALGGRRKVLDVFEEKHHIHKKVAFLVDNDMWLFEPSQAPDDNAALIRTWGYSIENDLYASGKMSIDFQLTPVEREQKVKLLQSAAAWFASEVRKFRAGLPISIDVTLLNTDLILENEYEIRKDFLGNANYIEPTSAELQEIVQDDTYRCLRGKFLFQTYLKIFNARQAEREKNVVFSPIKYKPEQLHTQCLARALETLQNPIGETMQKLVDFFADALP